VRKLSKVSNFAILIFCLSLVSPQASASIDKSDNKSPALVSAIVSKKDLKFGEKTSLILTIRDDKNELVQNYGIRYEPPDDAPGYLQLQGYGGFLYSTSRPIVNPVVRRTIDYVESTVIIPLIAPAWPGLFKGFGIDQIMDLNGNSISIDLINCVVSASNNLVSFSGLKPICDVDFRVSALTSTDKIVAESQLLTDSRKESIDKLAAKLKAIIIAKPDLKSVILKIQNSLNSIVVSSSVNEDYAFKQQLLPIEKQIQALERMATITCVAGNKTKKVTGVNPKCPSGYKKK
jgi:hypothetical protein